ncbi:DUF3299 domain-containing protein [Vibrio sp.]|nr:DUF3299 domain-containing protein [Vibrio sp.]
MTFKNTIFSIIITFLGTTQLSYAIQELDWQSLIPESARKSMSLQQQLMSQTNHTIDAQTPQSQISEVRMDLHGEYVKIPGYIIPLEGDHEKTTEFLLVPFMGACIHVPPPPPNQIIHVSFPDGIPVTELWDLTYVIGKMNVTSQSFELANTGYSIDGLAIETFKEP